MEVENFLLFILKKKKIKNSQSARKLTSEYRENLLVDFFLFLFFNFIGQVFLGNLSMTFVHSRTRWNVDDE